MILKYWGHSFFTIHLENGKVIALDPYGDFYDFPKRKVRADVCLTSHHHHDHAGLGCLQEGVQVIDSTGMHKLEGASVKGIATWHDEKKGELRGPNTFYVVDAEDLRIGHAGDLGHVPTDMQARQIGTLDVLLLPVGGYYTVDAKTAVEVCRKLQPRMVIPMHYRTKYDEEMPISEVNEFLNLLKAEDAQLPLIRLTKADLCERPQVVTLAIQPE